MQPEWEKDRYITLLGDPIGPDGQPEKLRTSFYKAADIQAAGVATALGAVLALFLNTVPDVTRATLVPALNLLGDVYSRVSEKNSALPNSGFSENDIQTKCIDTRPDDKTIPTLDRYRSAAEEARLLSIVKLGMFLTANALLAPFLGASTLYVMLGLASVCVREGMCAHRFNKVANTDWVIVDMPKPKAVKETVREPAALPAPVAS